MSAERERKDHTTSRLQQHQQPRHQGLALCHRVTLDSVAHHWVLARTPTVHRCPTGKAVLGGRDVSRQTTKTSLESNVSSQTGAVRHFVIIQYQRFDFVEAKREIKRLHDEHVKEISSSFHSTDDMCAWLKEFTWLKFKSRPKMGHSSTRHVSLCASQHTEHQHKFSFF